MGNDYDLIDVDLFNPSWDFINNWIEQHKIDASIETQEQTHVPNKI